MVSAAVSVLSTGSQASYGTSATSSSDSSNVSFDKVMSASLSAGAKNNSYSTSKSTTQITSTTKTNASSDENTSSKLSDTQTKKTDTTVKADATKMDSTNQTDAKSQLEDLAEDVKDKIKETFDLTDEQIQDAMTVLGMNMMDLLQPDQLTQLVATVNGQNDALSILVDENLSSGLQDLLQFVNEQVSQISDATGISIEDLAQMITTLDGQNTEQPEIMDVKTTVASESGNAPVQTDENQNQTEQTDEMTDPLTDAITSKMTTSNSDKTSDGENAFSKNQQSTKTETQTTQEPVASNLAQSINNTFSEVIVNASESVNAADIVRQVVEAVRVTATQQLQSIEVALNPENLGKVTMNVSAKNGIVTAQLVAENEQVKHALENQMVTLKERFDNQGIKVDAVEVTVQSHSFEANENLKGNDSEEQKENKKSSGHLRLDSLDDLDDNELSDEELRARDLINNGVSSVEYSA